MFAMTVDDNQQLVWGAHAPRELHATEVRIAVKATALNRADLMQRAGLYPPPKGCSDILGLECSGEIVELGSEVEEWQIGDRVCALLTDGGYATEVVCDASQLLPIPQGMNFEEAAALPEVFATAWLNIFVLGGAVEGDKVLLKAGGSGVGTAAIQLCSAFGNPVYVQVGDDEKLKRCIELGASGGINRHSQTLSDLKQASPFDVILDPVGGESLAETTKLLNTDGSLILIGIMGGRMGQLDMGRMLVKRQRVIGSTLRSLPLSKKAEVISQLRQKVWPLFDTGKLKPEVDRIFEMSEAEQAHQYMQSNQSFGKIVVRVG